jgi:AcrR family transcriptional regulator
MQEVGLRERKKAATRALIANTAERLFAKHGFDAVTIERVAEECVLSAKTVLRYFPTKESLALARLLDLLESFKEGLASRDTDVVSYWRAYIASSAREEATHEETRRGYFEMIRANPRLEAHYIGITPQFEDALADALAEEAGDYGLGPRLLAALLVASNSAVGRHLHAIDAPLDPDAFVAVVDYVKEMFAGGFPTSRRVRRRTERGAIAALRR